MPHEFTTRRRVEFSDTDMAGIVHFAQYFRYMETAEHDFFRSLGILLQPSRGVARHSFARAQARCDYLAPLRCYDEVEIRLLVERIGTTSLTYRFELTKTEDRGEPCERAPVACGSITVVCVSEGPDGNSIRPVSIDPAVRARLEGAPPDQLE